MGVTLGNCPHEDRKGYHGNKVWWWALGRERTRARKSSWFKPQYLVAGELLGWDPVMSWLYSTPATSLPWSPVNGDI